MKEINYFDVMGYTAEKMSRGGVFLNVAGDTPNTMTIGWGWMGYCWKKGVFAVVVRPQRHTFELIQKAGCFTVSVPTDVPLAKELIYAGTRSGRDENKFEGHGLTAAPAQKVNAPIVAECGLHFECRIVMSADMPEDSMDANILASCYPQRDMHGMFFGEIVACYATDDAFAAKYAR